MANSHARRAISLDSSLGTAHYNCGNSYFALGMPDDALRAFQAALEQDPANDHYWANYLFTLNFAPSATRQLSMRRIALGRGTEGLSDGTSLRSISRRRDHGPDAQTQTCLLSARARQARNYPVFERHATLSRPGPV